MQYSTSKKYIRRLQVDEFAVTLEENDCCMAWKLSVGHFQCKIDVVSPQCPILPVNHGPLFGGPGVGLYCSPLSKIHSLIMRCSY